MRILRLLFTVFMMSASILTKAQPNIERVEPPHWWVDMKNPNLQLLVYGKNIGTANVSIDYKGVNLLKVNRVENPNYLFLDLELTKNAKDGKLEIAFNQSGKSFTHEYELRKRDKNAKGQQGFGTQDFIYLLMPDRFANGNPEIDSVEGMLEKADRTDLNGRHGGDIAGILKNLDYLHNLGVTTLWINPLLENNQPKYSYHGYAITDFYKIDPRFGSNQDYLQLVEAIHEKGMKIIMDMVFNHCGIENWLIKDLPMADWIHQFPEFTRTNYRASIISDPYSSDSDEYLMEKGWFDTTMPDLNQDNPFVQRYLVQNSLWWIEYAGLDGIRMDTHPYPQKDFMAAWIQEVMAQYPNFNIVGEAWLQKEAITAYWQQTDRNKDGYNSNLRSVTDFPMQGALSKAFNEQESWTDGLSRLYYVLAQDFLYTDAFQNVIFLDNHDQSRYYTSVNYNVASVKMGMGILATTRGIPQLYYGTEVLLDGEEHDGHGTIREDFPGGWPDDAVDAFTAKGLTQEQIDVQNYTKKLLNWRKNATVIHKGKLKHYVPENGVYVYFRYTDNESVMVILNNKYAQKLDTGRFTENLKGYSRAIDVISGKEYDELKIINLPAKSITILELMP